MRWCHTCIWSVYCIGKSISRADSKIRWKLGGPLSRNILVSLYLLQYCELKYGVYGIYSCRYLLVLFFASGCHTEAPRGYRHAARTRAWGRALDLLRHDADLVNDQQQVGVDFLARISLIQASVIQNIDISCLHN